MLQRLFIASNCCCLLLIVCALFTLRLMFRSLTVSNPFTGRRRIVAKTGDNLVCRGSKQQRRSAGRKPFIAVYRPSPEADRNNP